MATGCAFPRHRIRWERPPGHEPVAASVLVEIFDDLRPGATDDSRFLAWLPLVPFGVTRYHRPGTQLGFHEPGTLLSRAFAFELEQARVFSIVRRAPLPPSGDAPPPTEQAAHYILRGTVRMASVNMKYITYGLSFVGTGLWLLGLPIRHIGLELEVELSLHETETGRVVWTHLLQEEWSQFQGIYYGRNFFHFPDMARRGVQRALIDLDAAIAGGALEV